jgi:hydroxymethylbilane synthase
MPRPLRVATRGSELARWQANRVATLLGDDVELVIVTTSGDVRTDVPIHAVGGTGIFVKEVQQAVLDGRADLAVHSAKDLPASDNPDGLVLAATPERADPRDALVGSTLAALPAGGRVATGSVRRRAQLAALRPDLTFAELRGNIATRLSRAVDFDAVVVAAAALVRLGLTDKIDEYLEPAVLLPQVGQGALAVECRVDDNDTLTRVRAIDDPLVHLAVGAERAYLAELGGGCDLPCGAFAQIERGRDGDEIEIEALLASTDGHVVLRATARDSDAVTAGRAVAAELMDRGGRSLLEDGDLQDGAE